MFSRYPWKSHQARSDRYDAEDIKDHGRKFLLSIYCARLTKLSIELMGKSFYDPDNLSPPGYSGSPFHSDQNYFC